MLRVDPGEEEIKNQEQGDQSMPGTKPVFYLKSPLHNACGP
jgi:hypothetical protein